MDKIDFDGMKKKNKALYQALWEGVNFDAPIEQTWNEKYEKYSSNSYSFSKASLLINIFNIKNPTLFEKKYKMAVGGSGNEGDKITALHSSSLCALLHFYNVEKHALTLEFKTKNNKNGEIKRRVRFTKSVFEFKSPVIDNPSNMDVVLIGKDETSNEDVVLFLESKFAEYYLSAGTTCRGISKNYLDNEYTQALYKKNNIGALELKIEDSKNDPAKFDLVTKDPNEPFYIAGIKQMISHYCGIRNLLASKKYTEKDAYRKEKVQEKVESKIEKEKSVVMLGEIVFDSKIGDLKLSSDSKKTCLEIYREKYQELAKIIAAIDNLPENFEIVKDLLCYSTIRDKIEDKVKAFYYGK